MLYVDNIRVIAIYLPLVDIRAFACVNKSYYLALSSILIKEKIDYTLKRLEDHYDNTKGKFTVPLNLNNVSLVKLFNHPLKIFERSLSYYNTLISILDHEIYKIKSTKHAIRTKISNARWKFVKAEVDKEYGQLSYTCCLPANKKLKTSEEIQTYYIAQVEISLLKEHYFYSLCISIYEDPILNPNEDKRSCCFLIERENLREVLEHLFGFNPYIINPKDIPHK